MLSASVSNIELVREWSGEDTCPYCGGNGCTACDNQGYRDTEWLLRKLRGEEPQSEQMLAGEALHHFLENAPVDSEFYTLEGEYKGIYWRFDFAADCAVDELTFRELPIEKQYGDVLVRGRIDGTNGKRITDFKTTSRFDSDKLFEGCQWRFYLDMLDADEFQWVVFVMRELAEHYYEIYQVHDMRQHRYPKLHEECLAMAQGFANFVSALPPERWQRKAVPAG